MRLFPAKGFIGTSMQDIAEMANVSKLTLYSHFDDKEALFRCALETVCTSALPASEIAQLWSEQTPEQILFGVGREMMNAYVSSDGLALYRLMLHEAPLQPELTKFYVQTFMSAMLERMSTAIAYIAQDGVYAFPDLVMAAQHFYALCKGTMHPQFIFNVPPLPDRNTQDKYLHDVVAVFLRAYKA